MMINANTYWESDHIKIIYPASKRLQIPMPHILGEVDDASKSNLNALITLADDFIDKNRKLLEDLFV